jgi:FKBP-type peptidyl-prolyl cis-trans isomerase
MSWSQVSPAQPGQAAPVAGNSAAPSDTVFRQQVSYALGRNFAMNLRDSEIDCELQSLMAGISDVLRNAQPKWTDEQLGPVMERFAQEMRQKSAARMQREGLENKRAADAFLAENKNREGVQTTESGLQFRVLRQGDGPSPTLADSVRCNYSGQLLNGTEFDSTAQHGEPATFRVDEVIPGWTEALQKMRVGDKWQLFIPSDLAYGRNGRPGSPIGPNSMLIFEIELLEIINP